ncbi:N-acetyl-alpha-D-glucosaminyl L-malate synthase BshA [Candidatus Bipolaricaulota bacterium]|nr:N-acetyl-alpha-D-glucosaminyl L-malate synthase BshA [Candidatus Bipolaricaulota bacterium]
MRIGISCYATHGGSGVVATELGKHLAERGHEVAFITYAAPFRLGPIPPRITLHEVEINEYPLLRNFPYTLALASKMAEVVRAHKLQILHVHYAIPFGAAALLARQIAADLPLRVITTLHGTDITLVGNNSSFRPVTKMTIQTSDAVTAVSSYLRSETVRQFDITRPIQIIPNFADPDADGEAPPCCLEEALDGETPVLIHISNFRPVKRVLDVVRTFAAVRREIEAKLILVGDGPDAAMAHGELEQRGLTKDAVFVGIVRNVAPILKLADVLLLPSETESFGLAALEAMAAGVPVVASQVGGLPEVVDHSRTGFLEQVGDIDAMAARVIEIVTNRPFRVQMGEAARQRAALFHSKRIVPMYESLYEDTLRASDNELPLGSSR